jgi:anti-sigma B factor antagonist
MNISMLKQDATAVVVRLEGRLDALAAEETRARLEALVADRPARLLVDMAGVPFVDSSGLGALVAVLKAARRSGGEMALVSPQAQTRKLLTLTTLSRVLPIVDSPDTAL